MSLYDQMRQGFAKALQIASDNSLYDSLPECSMLSGINLISIKAENQSQITQFHRGLGFSSSPKFNIKFNLYDVCNGKTTIFEANLISGRGFVVSTTKGLIVMEIKPPQNSKQILGKIVHPSQATIYKVFNSQKFVNGYEVRKPSDDKTIAFVEKAPLSVYSLAKIVGILDNESVYWFRAANECIIGHIRPKLSLCGTSMIIKFTTSFSDPQLRAMLIGVSLLLFLNDSHPILLDSLQRSMDAMRLEL